MHDLQSYRSPATRCEIELRCPGCGRPFFVPEPDAEVSVSTCPHADCQLVSFVWAMAILGSIRFEGRLIDCKAVALSDLVRPPPPKTALELAPMLVILGLFLVVPLWMSCAVWDEDAGHRLIVLMMITPALFIGVLALIACGADLVDDLRRRRRSTNKRRDSLQRARWLESRSVPP